MQTGRPGEDEETVPDAARPAEGTPAAPAAAPEPVAAGPAPDAATEPEPLSASGPAPAVTEPTSPEPGPPSPEPEPEPESRAHAAAEEEPHHSVAGRILTWLAILAAGGVLFLWAGPRVAPHLPGGLAPVAEWLTPGARDKEAAIEAVRSELTGQIAAIRPGLGPVEVESLVAARVTAALARDEADRKFAAVEERIAALADQVAAADSSTIEARLAQAESRLAGVVAELGALRGQLAETMPGAGAEAPAAVPAETAVRIAALAATGEGLRAELQTLAGQVGALGQRIDEVEASARRREAEVAARASEIEAIALRRQTEAALLTALASLGARIEAGEPYADLLTGFAALTPQEPPADLVTAATTGVPSLASLRAMFPEAAHAAIRASIRAEAGEGVLDRAATFLEARVATRSLGERAGTDPDAILSRVAARMAEDRLDAALAEAAALPEVARAPLADWIAAASMRERVRAAFAMFRTATGAAG